MLGYFVMKIHAKGTLGEFFSHLDWESEKVKELKNLTGMMGKNSTVLVEVDKRDYRRIKSVEVIQGSWWKRGWKIAQRKWRSGRNQTFHFGKNDIRRDLGSYLDHLTDEVTGIDHVRGDEKTIREFRKEAEKLQQLEQDVNIIADQLFNTQDSRILKGKMERLRQAFNDRFAFLNADRKSDDEELGNEIGNRSIGEKAALITDSSELENKDQPEWGPVDDLFLLTERLGLSYGRNWCKTVSSDDLNEEVKARIEEHDKSTRDPYLANNTVVDLLQTKSSNTKEYRAVYNDLIRELHKEEGPISDEIWKEVLLGLCKHAIKLRDHYH